MRNNLPSYLQGLENDDPSLDWGIRVATPDGSSEDGRSEDGSPDDRNPLSTEGLRLALINEMARNDEEAFQLAHSVADECSKFCQDYSDYQSLTLRFTTHAQDKTFAPEIEPTEIDLEFESDENIVFGSPLSFYDLRVSVRDAKAIATKWEKSGYAAPKLEASLSTTLSLCSSKIKIASQQFAEYYKKRSLREQNLIMLYSEMHVNLVLRLAGLVPTYHEVRIPRSPELHTHINFHESRLEAANIDFSDVPDHFLCPISGEIMDNPMSVGTVDCQHTYNSSLLDRLWAEEGESAKCPLSQRPLSELTFSANKELDDEIKSWVEEKLKSGTKLKAGN